MGTSRRAPGRRRGASLPQFEALEGRCTPTALPAGFTEAAVATGLSSPTAMEFAPDGRLFVLEQAGNVEFVRGDGTTWTALHLNVDSQGERGLLGIAFDPAFASNHFVYLYYTNPGAGGAPWATGEHNQLSRFTVDDSDPTRPIFKDEAPILDWDNLSAATNHNGGAIHFGLDGMLYADAGDNVQTFTQGGNTYRVSQTLSDLLGKQLRIDVGAFNRGVATRDDTAVGHLIPADNPFVGTAPGIDQLIYALGLRNPYTFAVQPGTGTIFINDVGETTWEEIDRSVPGANFGWSGGNTDGFGHSSPQALASITTRCSPTTTREARPAAASPSSAAPSTTRPRRNSRPPTSASISTPTSAAAGSACSIPRTRAAPRTPTRRPPSPPASRAP